MEARIARLEADVAHLRTDVGDIKVDLRTLRDKTDARMDRLEAKLDTLKDTLTGLKPVARSSLAVRIADSASFKFLERAIYIGCTAAIYGGLAHGFGWI
ncbi:MAG: hypothetical protein ABI640_04435 [Gammaproteobacteria bacterium]